MSREMSRKWATFLDDSLDLNDAASTMFAIIVSHKCHNLLLFFYRSFNQI